MWRVYGASSTIAGVSLTSSVTVGFGPLGVLRVDLRAASVGGRVEGGPPSVGPPPSCDEPQCARASANDCSGGARSAAGAGA